MFEGAIVAIVTPFRKGIIDYEAFEKLIEFQVSEGIDGIVPCGTTGESPTLSHEEHKEVIRFTVEIVKNRVPVIAGTGSNNTVEAIELTSHAKSVKANGVLMTTPYYNKPNQEGLFLHYSKVADQVDIPIVLYNIPSRTSINMTAETIIRLSKHKNIVGVKEAAGSMDQAMAIIKGTQHFDLLSGDDLLTLPLCSIGGAGVISVLANLLPRETVEFVSHCHKGDLEKAQDMNY
ncbi:MAG TPA: 4-hydroxy-tetrahydrodipicolinate synthase, partial [Spirochaetes bacterium]|nr:4-hydroxy-tetrahydrodipicolinate synthase [Spirochaetota bacterium]